MQRSRLTALGLAALLALPSAAAEAQTLWVGNMFITAVPNPAKCVNSSGVTIAEVGDYYRAVYRPAGTALGNGADSYLALTTQRSSFTITVPNNSFQAGINYGSSYVGSSITFGSNTGGITRWTQVPATLAAGTANVNLTAALANFWNLTGCTVTLQGGLTQSP